MKERKWEKKKKKAKTLFGPASNHFGPTARLPLLGDTDAWGPRVGPVSSASRAQDAELSVTNLAGEPASVAAESRASRDSNLPWTVYERGRLPSQSTEAPRAGSHPRRPNLREEREEWMPSRLFLPSS
jgi:hypothetical protein